jgi:hypothetical protein
MFLAVQPKNGLFGNPHGGLVFFMGSRSVLRFAICFFLRFLCLFYLAVVESMALKLVSFRQRPCAS